MNKRIQELLLEAGFTNAYRNLDEGFELVFVNEEHTTECVQKFATLLVNECITALDKDVYLATCEDGEQAFHDVILLEHFGVEFLG